MPPGIFKHVADFIARVKRTPGYTPAMGEALGIEAPETEEKSRQDHQPTMKSDGTNAGHPVARIDRDGAPQAEVFRDHGGASMAHHHHDALGVYRHAPAAAAGTAQVWRYQAICHDGNGPFGQMSAVLSVTVRGM